MPVVAWVIAGLAAVYLFYRWFVLSEIRDQLKALNARRAEDEARLNSEIDHLQRRFTEIQIAVQGIRRKLGFDNDWAEAKDLEDQIKSLQGELERRKKREAA